MHPSCRWCCRCCCRYSRGGTAVRHQYYAVVRLMKQARHEGRKGASYVDLVQAALASLPDRRVQRQALR